MARIGVISISDGRDHAHGGIVGFIRTVEEAQHLARVHLYPAMFFVPAGAASVHHLAAPGQPALAHLTRKDGDNRMQLIPGDFRPRFGANHIHAIPGDHSPAVHAACELLGVTVHEFSRAA
ncbi:hypothetical protein OHB26_02475 [Nocardia sp. NBC_01503]|uniref:hypothetical protein n=1 Tax=Nocardia sp. NBC_01503 TaxID=2975997 RepID=UPI002E7AD5D1|nr:hypothetical protein [Nocardia sp. NBC_01503]WTL33141.1 hypothetical protein OHB26_02475 [Nocardia sp. NBC_01503]